MSDPTEPILITEQRGAVLILRLNRPEARNALNLEMFGEFGKAVVEAEERPGHPRRRAHRHRRQGVLRRHGPGRLRRRVRSDRGAADRPRRSSATSPRARSPCRSSAPLNATAVAGGFELVLGCDVVVASEDAKFGLPEVKRGLFAAGGGIMIGTRIPQAAPSSSPSPVTTSTPSGPTTSGS